MDMDRQAVGASEALGSPTCPHHDGELSVGEKTAMPDLGC
jgi:hypothetical protein